MSLHPAPLAMCWTAMRVTGLPASLVPCSGACTQFASELRDAQSAWMLQVLAQGPGVMKGYFKDEGATAKAFRAGHGWLDTGDLGWQAPGTLTEP